MDLRAGKQTADFPEENKCATASLSMRCKECYNRLLHDVSKRGVFMMDVLLLLGRLLLSVFFVAEAVDKIRRFGFWSSFVRNAGMPFPAAEMVLVITLLVLGSASLITGLQVQVGAVLLLVFLIPTALLFESRDAAIKSVSLAGALLLLMATGPGRWAVGATPSSGVPAVLDAQP